MRKIGLDTRIHETAVINEEANIDIGDHNIIDIGVYISVNAFIGNYVHIAPYTCIIGGRRSSLIMEDFTAIAAGSKIICGSDNYKNSLLGPQIKPKYRNIKTTEVIFKKYSCAGANSVVMPGVILAEGSALGANSLLTKNTEPWGIYVGSPAKLVSYRDKDDILLNSERLYKIDEYKRTMTERHRFTKEELPEYAHLELDSVGSVGNLGFVINHLYFMRGLCKAVYIDITKGKMDIIGEKINRYDNVLIQNTGPNYKRVNCYGNGLFDYDGEILEDIRETVKPYFKFQSSLQDEADSFCKLHNIGEDTLGVHIRMNDMNAWHGDQFGEIIFKDYKKAIDKKLSKRNIKNIFISSDNNETLAKLKNRYSNLVYHKNVFRANKEQQPGTEDELRAMGFEKLRGKYAFESPFLDFLTLIKCGHFIGRKHSNFSIAAVMLGGMKFDNIINLGK